MTSHARKGDGSRVRRRRWLRFSLRTLLLFMTLVALGLGIGLNGFRQQRNAVRVVREAGGTVLYGLYEVGAAPRWKRQLVGEDCLLSEKLAVNLSGTHVGEHVFVALQDLPQVEKLHLLEAQLSEAELEQLGKLSNLQLLNLNQATFDERGLAHLSNLTKLRELHLNDTPVTDRGLALLRPPNLRSLRLSGTGVTKEGILQLEKDLPKCSVGWDEPYEPPVEDAGGGGLGGALP